MRMNVIAKYLIILGLAIALIGVGVMVCAKFNVPLGRLPGDILIRRENVTFYPVAGNTRLFYIDENQTGRRPKGAQVEESLV
jgi:hypothetical protein